eukprot:TRINITY_DN963_c0_g1_i13.p1 TRINITY_DN963_c0_g1~~TRINITY_DN963_c0_g1_i13.p1  ORF type:complete len:576 (+),score=61.86 TRINITY_DN963_c0_g1_i13:39-1730(+)
MGEPSTLAADPVVTTKPPTLAADPVIVTTVDFTINSLFGDGTGCRRYSSWSKSQLIEIGSRSPTASTTSDIIYHVPELHSVHSFPLRRVITNVTLNKIAVWVPYRFTVLLTGLFFIIFANILHKYHPAGLVVQCILYPFFIVISYTRQDRTLLRQLWYQFDVIYIWCWCIIFIVSGSLGLHQKTSTVGVAQYFAGYVLALPILTLLDSAPAYPVPVKLGMLMNGTITSVAVVIADLVTHEPYVRSLNICLVFCNTTLRVFHMANLNILAYNVRYLVHFLRSMRRGVHPFVVFRVPLLVQLRDEVEACWPEVHVQGVPTAVFPLQPSPQDSVFEHSPILAVAPRLTRQLWRHPWALLTVPTVLCSLGSSACVALTQRTDDGRPGVPWPVPLVTTLLAVWVLFAHLCVSDRTVFKAVARRFESLWLFVHSLRFVAFGAWGAARPASPQYRADPFAIVAVMSGLVALNVVVLLCDSLPGALSPRRRCCLFLCLIGFFIVAITCDSLHRGLRVGRVPICIIYCTDSREIALASLVVLAIFYLRFLLVSFFYPQRSLVLAVSGTYRLE